ncbi:MAG: hypothetical protein MHPSP_003636, partial [Paramarteilia canceri]
KDGYDQVKKILSIRGKETDKVKKDFEILSKKFKYSLNSCSKLLDQYDIRIKQKVKYLSNKEGETKISILEQCLTYFSELNQK